VAAIALVAALYGGEERPWRGTRGQGEGGGAGGGAARLKMACGYEATAAGDADSSAPGASDLRRSSRPGNGHRRWAMC
jgi:hypothetical protein